MASSYYCVRGKIEFAVRLSIFGIKMVLKTLVVIHIVLLISYSASQTVVNIRVHSLRNGSSFACSNFHENKTPFPIGYFGLV